MTEPAFVAVLRDADLAAGQMRCVDVGATTVLIARTKEGGLHALHGVCTHAYARLDEGRLRGNRVICPLHGAGFDVCTGRVLSSPARTPLPTYAVRVVDGQIEVQVSEQA